jgi:hypothetical protein
MDGSWMVPRTGLDVVRRIVDRYGTGYTTILTFNPQPVTIPTNLFWRMVSSGMLCRVALVRTDISEESSASFIRVTRISELGTTLAVTSNRRTLRRNPLRNVRRLLVTASVVPSSSILVTLMNEALSSSETPVLTRVTRRNIPEDAILHSHLRENLKSYIISFGSL